MRLSKPGEVDNDKKMTIGQMSLKNKRPPRLISFIALALIVIIAIGFYYHHRNNATQKAHIDQDANVSLINMLKDSKSLDDKRSISSAYLANSDYAKAEAVTKEVAQQSNEVSDYLGLLNICTTGAVPDKQNCVDFAISKIKPHIEKLSFTQVYSAGSELDKSGFKKDAVIFYQRAYDIYDPARTDAYTKTKDQIKQRIAELNG